MEYGIFKFEFSDGACDYVVAKEKDEAIERHLAETACGDHDGCEITKLTEDQLKEHTLLDINESEPEELEKDDPDYVEWDEDDYCTGYLIISTFDEYLKDDGGYTHFLCTSEY